MKTLLALSGLALGFAAPLRAQTPAAPAPGTRVRITWRDEPARLDGTLRSLSGDTIVVYDSLTHREAAVPLAWLRSVEVYGGRRQGWAMTGLGVLVGGTAGGLLGYVLWTPKEEPSCANQSFCLDLSVHFSRETLTFIGAAAGASLFGLIGYFIDTADRWEPVLRDRVRLGLAPMPAGRLGVGASLSF